RRMPARSDSTAVGSRSPRPRSAATCRPCSNRWRKDRGGPKITVTSGRSTTGSLATPLRHNPALGIILQYMHQQTLQTPVLPNRPPSAAQRTGAAGGMVGFRAAPWVGSWCRHTKAERLGQRALAVITTLLRAIPSFDGSRSGFLRRHSADRHWRTVYTAL